MKRFGKEQLSQLLMVGFEGTQLPDFYRGWLGEGLGGIVLFSRNIVSPEQLSSLTHMIHEAFEKSPTGPAFISADQEGGRVFRLKDPFTHFPAARNLGNAFESSGTTDLAFETARATARELVAMGIRLNFAPVLDLHTNPKNPIIGDRAFGTEAERAAKVAVAYMNGLHAEGVMSCGKHFPGHGDTSQDSHLELPSVTADLKRLRQVEWIPFQRAIAAGLPMIMTAHVLLPNIDPDFPATLSPRILTGGLREELGFSGVIVADDLEMKAIAGRYPWREVVVRAINAGVDQLLVCKDQTVQQNVLRELENAVAAGEIPAARIEKALERIAAARARFLSDLSTPPWAGVIGCKAHLDLAEQGRRFA